MLLGGIRTHNLNRRATADLRLRPRGQWDRQISIYNSRKLFSERYELNLIQVA